MSFLDFSEGQSYTDFMMKILILGAQGNLGTQLSLAFKDYSLLTWDKDEANLFDLPDLVSKLDIASPDLIINAAAYNAVDKCEQDEEEKKLAWKLNKDLPEALAKWCRINDKIIVQYSTDYVFSGNQDKKEFFENDIQNPINVYGETKAAGEQDLISSSAKYYLIRVSKLFGPAGASPYSKKSFFDIMLDLSIKNSELSVVDNELSCFTYTPDLAEATRKLIDGHNDFGVYHLINEGAATWYEACQTLKEIAGFAAEVKPVDATLFPRPAARPEFSVLKNTKFTKLRTYQEALREYLNIKQ